MGVKILVVGEGLKPNISIPKVKVGSTIAFDLDGVMFSTDALFGKLKELYPNVDTEKIEDYDFGLSLYKQGLITEEEVEGFEGRFYKEHQEEIFSKTECYSDSVYFSRLLQSKGYNVIYITGRYDTPSVVELTRKTFERKGLPFENVHFVGSYSKKKKCNELGVSLLIEDKADTAISCTTGETAIDYVIVREQPYNKNTLYNDKVYCVSNFEVKSIMPLFKTGLLSKEIIK